MRPLISVLTPVHDPPLAMLEEAIASVRRQTFTGWELCLVDDGSTNPEITAALERHAATDPRIRLTRRATAGGISVATNAALELATGEYIALLDHDDTLTPDALQHVADRIADQPDLDMLYSDEDIVLDGRQIWVHLKPGWSPDTLRTNGYTCHLGVYRSALVREIGGFRTEYNGSQDVDMILRLVERTDRIGHIPRILYHWRAHANSTAGGDAKPYAYVAARNAIAAHLERCGLDAEVGYGPPGLYRLSHRVDRSTSVDLVLAVEDETGLSEAAASWLEQPHPAWNLVIAAPQGALDAVITALTNAGIPDARITTIPTTPDADPAAALADAATAATAEHLLLMQTPAMGLTHDWLTRLIGYSQQPHIAAAGPVVLAPDGRIQQAGIAIPTGIPLHLLHGTRSSMDNHFGFGTSVYNVSAVSGVLATRRDTYHHLGGLNPQFKDLALIHYCLRATDHHQRIVIVPDARLRTTGTRPRRQRPPHHLATPPRLGPHPHPRPLLQPQLPHRPRRLRADSIMTSMAHSSLRSAAARLQRRTGHTEAPSGERIPLSSLRARLDESSAQAYWSLNPDGVIGRALRTPAPSAVTYPLTLTHDVSLSARAMLLPHDWRDRQGAVRASISATTRDGTTSELWETVLHASDRGRPRGQVVRCQLPASTVSLTLSVDIERLVEPYPLRRAIWLEPTIIDPHAPPAPRAPAGASSRGLPRPPGEMLISVLVPVHDPPLAMLEEAIASVRRQTFTGWELCLVDDGSTNPEITAALERHAATDPRIRLARRATAGGISVATNAALELATGEYIALLDHDDTLTPDALQHVADRIADQPDLDMLYSDEDVVGGGRPPQRHPKPGWSPEHMSAAMYTCHLGVYRRSLVVGLGGFQPTYDGCQDYDLVLRLMDRTDRIGHIPRILYHWRAHANSTAGGDAKPYAYLAQPRAITDHLRRSGIDAEVQFGQLPGLHRIVHRVDRSTSVDLVLAVEDETGLSEAAASWLEQPHPAWNLVIAAPQGALDAVTTALTNAGIPDARITTIPTTPDADPAAALADAATAATAEHLLLMQTPAMGLTHDWLTRLIGYSQQPHIAAAGPVVLAPDGRIQQAGIAIPTGIPLHLHHGSPAAVALPVVYNLSAVSGVLATRRDTYHHLGGLNPQFKDLALIHYCLRATDHHQRIVIVPDARLRTTGKDPAANDLPTIWQLRHAWARTHTHDPYYNPNYRTDRGDFILRSHT